LSPRWQGLIVAVFLGYFLVGTALYSWTSYWILKDGQAGTAIITKDLWSGHNAVGYRYKVNNREYTGKDRRNWQDARYRNALVGQESIVYFSTSHPWLSGLNRPRTGLEGLPVVLIALILGVFAVVTIIDPKRGWAFGFNRGKLERDGG
jgi:hypothetical protein